jgi:putative flippase GtrA
MNIEIVSIVLKVKQTFEKTIVQNSEIIKFIVVGVLAVLIDGTTYALMVRALGFEQGLSKRVSFILGSIWAFFANKHYTFNSPAPARKEIILFSILYITTYFVNGWIHDITWKISDMDWLSFLTATAASTAINYLGLKFVVFHKS